MPIGHVGNTPKPLVPKKPLAQKERVVGIDLGTATTCVAVMESGKPRVIRSRLGYNTIPSILSFDDVGNPVVGHAAERQMLLTPEATIYGSKRLLGRVHSETAIERFQSHFPYKLVRDGQGFLAANIRGAVISPQDAAAYTLSEIRGVAELELGAHVTHAVITVPAYFNENQRNAVRQAGKDAGLHVLRIVNEPTSACVAYGLRAKKTQRVLVYDLGGGTFDVSHNQIDNAVYTVLATDGDTFLGGLDFDHRVVDYLVACLEKQIGTKVPLDPVAFQRITAAARESKHGLSGQSRTICSVPRLARVDGRDVDLEVSLTREILEDITKDLVDRTIEICDRALAAAKIAPRDVDELLLTGGQTRMPCVHKRLMEHFGRTPSKRVHPEEAVALGAAILADSHDRSGAVRLLDVLPIPIGYAKPDGTLVPLFPRNARLPASATAFFEPDLSVLDVLMFQGTDMQVSGNEFLGTCRVTGIPESGPRRVRLLCTLDAECKLTVTSSVEATGKEESVVLQTGHTPDEVLAALGKERLRVATRAGKPVSAVISAIPEARRKDNSLLARLARWFRGLFS